MNIKTDNCGLTIDDESMEAFLRQAMDSPLGESPTLDIGTGISPVCMEPRERGVFVSMWDEDGPLLDTTWDKDDIRLVHKFLGMVIAAQDKRAAQKKLDGEAAAIVEKKAQKEKAS